MGLRGEVVRFVLRREFCPCDVFRVGELLLQGGGPHLLP